MLSAYVVTILRYCDETHLTLSRSYSNISLPLGFGANNNAASSPFGAAKPAFGATNTPATGGIFGNAAANTNTGGGFGFGANQQQQPSNAFGTNAATTGGLFGSSKPAFGTATTTAGTTGGLFGATAGATGGGGVFGNAGANTGLGFGASGNQALVNGTTNPPYQAFTEKEAQGGTTNHFQTIAFMPAYAKYSLEVIFPHGSLLVENTDII